MAVNVLNFKLCVMLTLDSYTTVNQMSTDGPCVDLTVTVALTMTRTQHNVLVTGF